MALAKLPIYMRFCRFDANLGGRAREPAAKPPRRLVPRCERQGHHPLIHPRVAAWQVRLESAKTDHRQN